MKYSYNNYYKPSFFILLVIIILIILSGCVSQKKYDTALQEIARLSVDSVFQEYELAEANYESDEVIFRQENDLNKKSAKLDSLVDLVAMQQHQLNHRKDLINNFKNSSWKAEEREGELVIKLEDDILFGSASSTLSDEGEKVLRSISKALQRIEEPYEIWVVGHTDNRPFMSEERDNWDLSANRALTVVRSFIENKVDPSIITASAKSKYDPDLSNQSDSGMKLNRRTEIMIVPLESPYKVLTNLITK